MSAQSMLSRLLSRGRNASPESEALAAFLTASGVNRRAFFSLLADAVEGGAAAREVLDLGRDLWPDLRL